MIKSVHSIQITATACSFFCATIVVSRILSPGGNLVQLKAFAMASLSLSLLELIMKTSNVFLTFESVDEILWCDHSNETSSAVLLHGTICFSLFYKMKFCF